MSLREVSKNEMEKILAESISLREVIIKFGLSSNGSGGYRNIKKKITDLGLDIPKYNYYGDYAKIKLRWNDERVYCEHSKYPRQKLKNRIIKENLIEYICEICKNTGEHMGEKLSLQLDHTNGVNDDNRLWNLRFLCPNCHSQTKTYAGKANKRS